MHGGVLWRVGLIITINLLSWGHQVTIKTHEGGLLPKLNTNFSNWRMAISQGWFIYKIAISLVSNFCISFIWLTWDSYFINKPAFKHLKRYVYLCKLLRTIFLQSFHYQFSTSTTWPSIRQSFHLLICTLFLKSLVHKIDFWTWFFAYFKLDFYCLCSLQKSSLK